ncbi:hypothetical protein [Massilia yuzhufengensis]|uniref:hypothetical protein n=1 Tax=Massilia yuzhufengensis TaxID=1164594 RepID=UPI0011607DF5|nr:hypothetical protein [Massilia yuzhufengensis]
MKKLKHLKHAMILLASTIYPMSAYSQDSNADYPPINIQGLEYANACSPDEKKDLRRLLFQKKIKDAGTAWELIDLLLCAPFTNENSKKMQNATFKKIRMELEGTGEAGPSIKMRYINPALVEALLAKKEAWDASLSVSDEIIKVHYFGNEYCVQERVIKYSKRKWKLFSYGQACD